MSIVQRMCKQQCTYWPQSGVDRQGNPTWGAPTVLACRWEDKVGEFLTAEGQTIQTGAQVYLLQDVTVGGKLWLGVETSSIPLPPLNTVWEIIHFSKNPRYPGRDFVRLATLAR